MKPTQDLVTSETTEELKEVLNIGLGKAAGILSKLVDSHIDMSIPSIKVVNLNEIDKNFNYLDTVYGVDLTFTGDFSGKAGLILAEKESLQLTTLFLDGENGEEIRFAREEVLGEVGNIIVNAILGAISNLAGKNLLYSLPSYIEGDLKDIVEHNWSKNIDTVVFANANLTIVDKKLRIDIILLFNHDEFEIFKKIFTDYFES